jgi:hypothetical protein
MALAVENTSVTSRQPAAKRGCVSKAMSTSGVRPAAAARRCNCVNHASNAIDATPAAQVHTGQWRAGPSTNASSSKPRPRPTSADPGQSMLAPAASRDSGM